MGILQKGQQKRHTGKALLLWRRGRIVIPVTAVTVKVSGAQHAKLFLYRIW